MALKTRFDRTGHREDLDEAITAGQEAVDTAPAGDPGGRASLHDPGAAPQTRFMRNRELEEETAPEEANELTRALTADPGSLPAMYLLGWLRWYRYQALPEGSGQQDLQVAVTMFTPCFMHGMTGLPEQLLPLLVDQAAPAVLGVLELTHRSSDLEVLSAAMDLSHRILTATPADHPDRAGRLSNLGSALFTRYERTGTAADLDTAITYLRDAVQALPAGHPDRGGRLSNLGVALQARFGRTGTTADLDAAIDAAQQAVNVTPADHPGHAGYLSNLGTALATRYERTGTAADLDTAIAHHRQAIHATPAGHPDRAEYLFNLGVALRVRFGRTGTTADLDAAIDAAQQAVNATPADHPDHGMYLSGLGNALVARYERAGTAADLDTAITHYRQAIHATPAGHPGRAVRLSNFAAAMSARYKRTGTTADLDTAIDVAQQAVNATPAGHPNRAAYLFNLGIDLRTRYERTGTAADLDAAVQRYTEAASMDMAAASVRISAGRAAASLVAETDPGRAASLLEAAVLLLPEVAPRFQERGDQQYAIGRFPGLAAEAAAAALSDPAVPEPQRPARALRLLEATRSVLFSQALSTRGDLSELRDRHPELARQFTELRDWLDQPSPAADLAGLPSDRGAGALRHEIRDRRQAAAEFTRLLARIRGLDGFAAFALPPSAQQLEAQGGQGPVVVFNTAARRSDAILLTSDGITSHPLPGLDQATVIEQVGAFYRALDNITGAESLLDWFRAQEALREVLGWLWDNAAGPVLDALGYQGPPAPGQRWPRLWWVPDWLLGLLPVHAAGHHTSPTDPDGRTVMDRVISSYTPTIGALAHARTPRTAPPGEASRSLIVAMPTTPDLPGQGRLAYVPAETAMLRERLPHPTLLTEPPDGHQTIDGQVPTRAAVLEHLPSCAIAHFSCHGYTDYADPSQSRLLLHDHRRNPLTVAALAPVALGHARLAYLSACSTARTGDFSLLDEAIHLATAFQLAGFPHVIGTLWEIDDATAVEIADSFYTALADPDGALDPDRAAQALHHAARAQRDQHPAAPHLWASHIHAGA